MKTMAREAFTYRDGIAIAQIVAFSPLFLFAVYFKHTGRIGWFCSGVFCLLRLIGASCKLAAMNSDSRGLSAAIFVCESLGMILIIFLLLGILDRLYVLKTIFIPDNPNLFRNAETKYFQPFQNAFSSSRPS
jgi:hypothetical protein